MSSSDKETLNFTKKNNLPSQSPKQQQQTQQNSSQQVTNKSTGPLRQIISASAGAGITALFTTPLDVVKTRIQNQNIASRPRPESAKIFAAAKPSPISTSIEFSGTLDGLRKIVRYEGVRNLWKGLPPALIMTIPSSGM